MYTERQMIGWSKKITWVVTIFTRLTGKPKTRWKKRHKEDLRIIKINNSAKCIQVRIKWEEVVEKAKIFKQWNCSAWWRERKKTVQLHDILKEKKCWVTCVCYVTERTISNFVSPLPALMTLQVCILRYQQYRHSGKNVQVEVKLSLPHAMTADRGITTPLILKIGARWRCVVNFTRRPL